MDTENRTTMNKHAKLIAEYAKDWAETDEPWERWEYQLPGEPNWEILTTHPVWVPYFVYRRKLQPEQQ